MKNTLNRTNRRFEIAEEMTREPEDTATEINQNETQKGKKDKKKRIDYQ